ncbi:ABC transporter ATP-binding protein [Halanaeroarchaeum sulfurireducens]|uniref:Probable branched-chain amino acid transport ATP-binding protein LivG n=1 Tax=Halanaeroarchaeum sulfurireducens TaxID=1604004 RepID=A0A0F7PAV5_9EURY|nr:ABC transporter ATP-binding protein [Halanaeroarchaeum sulfurireducens]AKH97275.1 amino acid/amide ABC transporter ATP-binding protein 1, haat family [Halanaeroarchaeum sulfurireducens]ALG81677.1 amino acid/amide ABC transporter ATP-binding protein 1, haat family [Halanaeroarchaeum sulfurireducens]
MSESTERLDPGAITGKDDVVLKTDGVTKSFGGLRANNDVSIEVERGSITGMIGPNGAGKSTLFNIISGFYEEDAGSVYVNDTDVTDMEPHEIAGEGLIRTFQTPRKLEGMTVREAMLLGPQEQIGESITALFSAPDRVGEQERRNLEQAEEMLERFEISDLARSPATEISGGQLKLVELARAMLAEPDILLLDEPVAGVNPTLANKLSTFITDLNEEGITFLIIEHDLEFLMEIADPIIVLDQGEILVEGDPEAVQNDQRVLDAYLGGADQ